MRKKPTTGPKKFRPSIMRKVMSRIHNFDTTTEEGRLMQKLWDAHLDSQARALAKNPLKLVKMSRKEKKKFNQAIRELRKEAQDRKGG